MVLRKKEKKKCKSKINIYVLIGLLLLPIGIGVIIADILSTSYQEHTEMDAVKRFYATETKNQETKIKESEVEGKKDTKVSYIATIKIPKIKLERGLVSPTSKFNNIEYNVSFLKDSAMPDEKDGNVIIASHSGNARVSYFRNLDKLEIDDKISLHYNEKNYTYSIVSIYDIEKTGQAKIIRNQNTNTLTLITCRHNTNRQIVIIAELIN